RSTKGPSPMYRYALAGVFALLYPGVEAVAAPRLALTSPVGGESWSAGSLHWITWQTEGLSADASVLASFSTDEGKTWTEAGKAPVSAGRLLWKVPDAPSRTARVRVSISGGPSVQNSAAFSVTASQEVQTYRWTPVTNKAPFAPRDGA